MKPPDIAALQEALGHTFASTQVLEQALTHSSRAREDQAQIATPPPRRGDNEQLEFLGDAILGFVVSEELFHRFPHFTEGELSKLRAHLVSEKHLIRVAKELHLGEYLRLGRGEEKSGGRHKTALLVDALEAVLAAVFLDQGSEAARRIVLRFIVQPELERLANSGRALPLTDYKSALQETLQAAGRSQPVYLLVDTHGPEHRKTFTVEVQLRNRDAPTPEFTGRAEGSTKKNAEQDGARQVLEYLAAFAGERESQHASESSASVKG